MSFQNLIRILENLLDLLRAHHVTELCIKPYKEVQHAPINVYALQHI